MDTVFAWRYRSQHFCEESRVGGIRSSIALFEYDLVLRSMELSELVLQGAESKSSVPMVDYKL